MRVVVVGDALLDRDLHGHADRLCSDSAGPVVEIEREEVRPGGAALAALAVAMMGGEVQLLTPIGADPASRELSELLESAGVQLVPIGSGATPEKVRTFANHILVARLDRNTAEHPQLRWSPQASRAVGHADAVLLSDYGRGVAGAWDAAALAPVVWDPHPSSRRHRGPLAAATPSEPDARRMLGVDGAVPCPELALRASAHWRCPVALTCGPAGAELAVDGRVRHVSCRPCHGDACGAGDWFAAGLTMSLASGAPLVEAVQEGTVAAGRWLSRGTAQRTTVVATSGCFDVLHIGHVALLGHARSLGDRLVVLLNSDASVRRLKGPSRPVNTEADRAALLLAIQDVDEVEIFDDLTPVAALERLRPDVFVKGADYEGADIPERATLARWGGRVAYAPFVPDRSTTRVLRLAAATG